ncbi:MAG: nucleoside recognition domain-containing protein [Bacteroidales bacterium]|nr:nucleoside recognition domain-containing protein [Bacteroidales bacterium]MCQ2169918.1 nucleoside recognition domain-containing protein [Bacteroidales bacterium]
MKKFRSGLICLGVLILVFGYLAYVMGASNMLNTIMHTAHDLLLNTCFFLMAICVLMGALSRLLLDFGVVDLIGRLFKPLMKPLFNLPGESSLGAVMTFLSDNPAIITLARDRKFSKKFKTYQFISLTNFGTAFGMGLIVIVFMIGQGFVWQPLVGLFGAFVGAIVSTRLMQLFTLKEHPEYREQQAVAGGGNDAAVEEEQDNGQSAFVKILNALLDGGKNGVEVGMSIIPGVLIISTLVMLLTFGTSAAGTYTGGAYEGTELLPWLAGKINFVFEWLFGFDDPHLVAFPITALGAVGAALGVIPRFIAEGWVNGNAVAVCTAIGMCWSGYMSTHTAMLDSLGYRNLTSKAIGAHTIGGLVAGMVAHWTMVLISLF